MNIFSKLLYMFSFLTFAFISYHIKYNPLIHYEIISLVQSLIKLFDFLIESDKNIANKLTIFRGVLSIKIPP